MNQVMNQSFRDWSSTRKFPFTDGSDMTCTDGRRIPLSAFTMITLFPDTEGSARISEINETGILFDMEGWTAFAAFSGYSDGWMPIMKEGSCVGSVMTNDNDLLYIKGMASFQSMVFTEGHLDLRPETVKGFCLDEPQLLPLPTFFGMPAITMSGYEMTKVVSSIVTDSTMSATEGANGEWALSSAQGPFHKPVTISLDNTTVTSSNNIIYYVFPYSRVSAILGVINIPTPPTGYHWSAVPFVQTAKSTVSVTASLMFLRTRTPGTSVSIPSSPVSPSGISISSSASSSSSVTTLAAEGWSISYEGTAWLRLASDGSSASDMMILSFGLKLTAVQN